MLRVGYIKVISSSISLEEIDKLKKEYNLNNLFIDKLNEDGGDRPQLRELLKYIKAGDTVIVKSILSFAYNTKDFINLFSRIKKKKAEFISIEEKIDTSSEVGVYLSSIFDKLNELEKYDRTLKQRKGIEKAKEKGKYKGRKRIIRKNFKKVYLQYEKGEIPLRTALELLSLKKNTFYRRAEEYKRERGFDSMPY